MIGTWPVHDRHTTITWSAHHNYMIGTWTVHDQHMTSICFNYLILVVCTWRRRTLHNCGPHTRWSQIHHEVLPQIPTSVATSNGTGHKCTHTTRCHIICGPAHNYVAGSSSYYSEGHMIPNVIIFVIFYSDRTLLLVTKVTDLVSFSVFWRNKSNRLLWLLTLQHRPTNHFAVRRERGGIFLWLLHCPWQY